MDQYSGTAQVIFNNRVLAECDEATCNIMSQNQEVNTFKKGLAGFSRGPTKVEISLGSAVPIAGYEVDYEDLCVKKLPCVVVMIDAGKRRRYEGWIDTVDKARSTSASAKATVKFIGKPVGSTF
jgi:hypothetical protein